MTTEKYIFFSGLFHKSKVEVISKVNLLGGLFVMNTYLRKKTNYYKNIILLSTIIVISSQLNINLFFNSNFKISIGIITLTILVFLSKEVPILPVTFLSGLGVFVSRILFHWLKYGSNINILMDYLPEIAFYISYGVIFVVYLKAVKQDLNIRKAALPLFIMDYGANLIELIFRININAFSLEAQVSIILVACVRTIIIYVVINAINYYGFSLINKEHAERYKKLLLLISTLKGEVAWMKKNTLLIENTMNISYKLYNDLKERDLEKDLALSALDVAKDIHEIKKEYYLIMRGISEALENELKDEGMYIYEIFKILGESIKKDISSKNKHLNLTIECSRSIYTNKQYLFMSIFRNLLTNSIEATQGHNIRVDLKEEKINRSYVFTIADYGTGIKKEDLMDIFTPGFSTKINYSTGEVSRGLGLPLVKDIVENQFQGSIKVESTNENTTFYIEIPEAILEERIA